MVIGLSGVQISLLSCDYVSLQTESDDKRFCYQLIINYKKIQGKTDQTKLVNNLSSQSVTRCTDEKPFKVVGSIEKEYLFTRTKQIQMRTIWWRIWRCKNESDL